MLLFTIYGLVAFLLITPVTILCKEGDSRAIPVLSIVMPYYLTLLVPVNKVTSVVHASAYRFKVNMPVSDAKTRFQKQHYRFII